MQPPVEYPLRTLVVAEYLRAVSAALPAARQFGVYCEALPGKLSWDVRAVVVKSSTAGYRHGVPVNQARVQIECYAESRNPQQAEALCGEIVAFLQAARHDATASGILMSAAYDGGGESVAVPADARPFALVYMTALVKQKET